MTARSHTRTRRRDKKRRAEARRVAGIERHRPPRDASRGTGAGVWGMPTQTPGSPDDTDHPKGP